MGLFNNSIMMGSSGAGAYEIERSLRFDVHGGNADGAHLQRTFGSAGNRKTWTFSFWTKKTGTGGEQVVFNGGGGGNGNTTIRWDTDDSFHVFEYNSGFTYRLHTNRLFRDPSAWYHIVVTLDTTQGTADNRIKIYVNGVQETSFANRTNPAQDTDYTLNNNIEHTIGNNAVENHNANYFNGYLTEINFVDGTALDASSFGKTDAATGQWIPKAYGGSHGTNGFYLNFSDNSNTTSGTLGDDDSANTNDWTPNNFSVAAGLDNDSFEDTPTNNWCTLNSNKFSADDVATFANGNLKVSQSANGQWQSTMGTIPVSSGKWYYEVKVHTKPTATTENWLAGFHDLALEHNNLYYGEAGNCAWGIDANNPEVFKDTDRTTGYGSAISDGDILQFALDVDAQKFWVGVNNTWTSSGDPAAGSNPSLSSLGSGKTWIPKISMYAYNTPWGVFEANFGAQGFSYTPPTDFKAINAANALPEPTIKKGGDYFNTITYTGDGNQTRTLSGVGFQPDLIWHRIRTGTTQGIGVFDAVRTFDTNKSLDTDTTTAEGQWNSANSSEYGYISSVNSDGFVVNDGTTSTNGGYVNYSGRTYAAWNWKESATAGFDIVSYTGDGNSNRDISHNLGVAPEFYIIKARSEAGHDWNCWHSAFASGQYASLNLTNAFTSDSGGFMHGAPTSSVIQLGTWNGVNKNTVTFIAYLFSSVEGYSKVGSYVGNGNANGTFVYTGFKPAFMLIKRNASESWIIVDNARDPYNPVAEYILADTNAAAASGVAYDFVSNGIKFRGTSQNEDGSTYIYLAFAEMPFKYANAR